jgi:hypothetical protein
MIGVLCGRGYEFEGQEAHAAADHIFDLSMGPLYASLHETNPILCHHTRDSTAAFPSAWDTCNGGAYGRLASSAFSPSQDCVRMKIE